MVDWIHVLIARKTIQIEPNSFARGERGCFLSGFAYWAFKQLIRWCHWGWHFSWKNRTRKITWFGSVSELTGKGFFSLHLVEIEFWFGAIRLAYLTIPFAVFNDFVTFDSNASSPPKVYLQHASNGWLNQFTNNTSYLQSFFSPMRSFMLHSHIC